MRAPARGILCAARALRAARTAPCNTTEGACSYTDSFSLRAAGAHRSCRTAEGARSSSAACSAAAACPAALEGAPPEPCAAMAMPATTPLARALRFSASAPARRLSLSSQQTWYSPIMALVPCTPWLGTQIRAAWGSSTCVTRTMRMQHGA